MPGIITITTDFGDVYPAVMKGVIAGIEGDLHIIDITNRLPQGHIRRGAFVLQYASGYFPAGTMHLAVVDPGVGSDRRALVIMGEKYSFVGPDNGLLMPAARAQGRFRAYEITAIDFFTECVSPVFHGRDVLAPAAALIASGRDVPGLQEIRDPVDLDFGVPRIEEDTITGQVIYTDDFGNVITNVGGDVIRGVCRPGEPLEVNGMSARYVSAYYEGRGDELMVLTGSHGMVEIAYRNGSAAELTGLSDDAEVFIYTKAPPGDKEI